MRVKRGETVKTGDDSGDPPSRGTRRRFWAVASRASWRGARERLARWARALKRDIAAMVLALADPETGWPARAVLVLVLAYALSPVDLIPDFIPVIGLLDDLLIVPAGLMLAIWLMPPGLLARHRAAAEAHLERADVPAWLRALGLALVLIAWAAAAWLIYSAVA